MDAKSPATVVAGLFALMNNFTLRRFFVEFFKEWIDSIFQEEAN